MGYADSPLAATAWTYGWQLVTRNEDAIVHCGISIINPWK
jgi:hypothetical protein